MNTENLAPEMKSLVEELLAAAKADLLVMKQSHLALKDLRSAESKLESICAKYHHEANPQPETRYFQREEIKAAEKLVALNELLFQQALLNDKIAVATKEHSDAFRAYLKESNSFYSR